MRVHDPPRFGTAGELYSKAFYDQLARVLRRAPVACSLHRPAQQADQRPRRAERGREAPAARGFEAAERYGVLA